MPKRDGYVFCKCERHALELFLIKVENERQKREEREMMQAQYGSLRKHQNRYNSIMNEVEPEYMTPTVNFEKRTNRLAYELLEPDSQ